MNAEKILIPAPMCKPQFWLQRLLAVGLPSLFIAASLAQQEPEAAPAPKSAAYWAASVEAETAKEYDKAIEQITLYQKNDGDSFLSMLRYAWLNYLKGDLEKAETGYNNALKMERASLNAALGLLDVAQAKQEQKGIITAAETVVRISPYNYRALMILGAYQYQDKDYRKSATTYHKVLLVYPDDIDAMSGAAWADLYTGAKREALAGFKKILSIQPDYTYAQQGYDLLMKKAPK